MVLEDLRRVMQAGTVAQGAQDPVGVLRAAQVVSGRPEFDRERTRRADHRQAGDEIAASRDRPLDVDREVSIPWS